MVRDTSTGSRTTGGSGSKLQVQDKSGLVERICAVDVCEVFSPPRVTAEAARFGMSAGDAMDLTTGWDFNIPEHRQKAEQYVDQEKPLVLIGSPPCVAFSQLQSLIPESENKARKLEEGIRHMEFMVKLYKKQVEGGRIFLHENPAHATTWGTPMHQENDAGD